MKNVLSKIFSILSTLLIIFEVIVILVLVLSRASGEIPSVFGYSFSVIATPSMSPAINVGDIIISKEYTQDMLSELEEGDIITFTGQSGEIKGYPVTHRIVSIGDDYVVTKGDSNISDDGEIPASAIISVLVYKTVFLGFVYKILNAPLGFLLIIVVPIILLIIFEIAAFVKAAKKEKQGD